MKFSKLFVAINIMAMLGIIGISGCGDDTDPPTPTPEPDEEVALTADAGPDQTMDLGDDITLDGNGSSSSDGSSFDYLWEVTETPPNSTASLTGETTASPTFTPNEAGDYTVTLTISNEDTESSDEVLITVEQVGATVEIGGVIDEDTSLPDIFTDPEMPDYFASSNLDVRAELTVEPGVVIHFAENVVLDIESGSGVLIAEGNADNPIVFTSANAENGIYWKGIYIASTTVLNSLDYVTVSYAGNSDHDFSYENFPAAVGVESTGRVSVTNSTFIDNKGYGLYADDDGGQIENFGNNVFENNDRAIGVPADEVDALDSNTTFANNADAQVEIFSTTYAESKSSEWPDLNGDASYRVTGRLKIEGDLSIAPGAIFEFDENVLMTVSGSIQADGTSSAPITFTTSNLEGNLYWTGIYISSASSLNSFSYVNLSYAGSQKMDFSYTNYAAGIGVESTGNVSVNNSTISDNKEYGLYIDDDGGRIESFSNNHFENNLVGVGVPANEVGDIDGNTTFANNSAAEVEIFSTKFSETETATWNALSEDATYRLSGYLEVNGVLTLAPGVTIEVDEDVQIRVNGALIAEGTEDNRITFTSSNVDGGLLWKGLFFLSADSRNKLDHVRVAYAGSSAHDFSYDNYKAAVGINTDAVLTVTNSIFERSGGYGIYNKGNLTASDNIYKGNVNDINL